MASDLDDKTYRHLLDETYAVIDRAFEEVDPDLAEVSVDSGTLTILMRGRVKCLVTPQPPVRQIWMAYRDNAWHFDHQGVTGRWLDDRGRGLDLMRVVETVTREGAGVEIKLP